MNSYCQDCFYIKKSTFLIVLIIFFLLYIYRTHNLNIFKKNYIKQYKQQNQQNPNLNHIQKRQVLEQRDQKVIYDNTTQPTRRLPEHQYPNDNIKQMINIPTRGYPDNFQVLGVLVRQSDEKIMQLYGRQKYPGSNQWEYYVVGNDSTSFKNKIPIPNDKEITDGDTIKVDALDSSKGDFKATIYDYDVPRYNPYII